MSRTGKWEGHGRIAIIQLSNPPINSVNDKLLLDLAQTLDEIEESDDIRVLVIVSAISKVFATGRQSGSEADRFLGNQKLCNVLKKIANQSLPSISIISGKAVGPGLEIALACDLRISDRSSKFGFYSDVSPTSISKASLIELIGPAKAKEMIWLGQLFNAQEAIAVGMVNRIFPESLLLNEGLEMANSIIHQKK